MPRYTPHPEQGIKYVNPIGWWRRWPLLRQIGWHQAGGVIRLKIGLTRKQGRGDPIAGVLKIRRSGYTGVNSMPFDIPGDEWKGNNCTVEMKTGWELTGDGHHTIGLRLDEQDELEIMSVNTLSAAAGVGAMIGMLSLLLAAAGIAAAIWL